MWKVRLNIEAISDGTLTVQVYQGHSNNNYNASFGSSNNKFNDNKERVGIKQIFKLQPEFVILRNGAGALVRFYSTILT